MSDSQEDQFEKAKNDLAVKVAVEGGKQMLTQGVDVIKQQMEDRKLTDYMELKIDNEEEENRKARERNDTMISKANQYV